MQKRFLIALLLLMTIVAKQQYPVKKIVVVMMENRSFDHILGYLQKLNSNITGLDGSESNPKNTSNPNSHKVKVTFDAPYLTPVNPGHDVHSTNFELWGQTTKLWQAKMNGFYEEMLTYQGYNEEDAKISMRCFNNTAVPILSTLALDFLLFDFWFSSVPGPTFPNRAFAQTGTSNGEADNGEFIHDGFPQRTFFEDVYDSGKDFGIYFSDFPLSLLYRRLRDYPDHVHTIDDFLDHAASGKLPDFSWVEPRWFDFLDWQESDEHPHHVPGILTGSVLNGEWFLKEVYEAVRNGPDWNETMFVVYYDEHGGFFDHVPPPQDNIPNPDGKIDHQVNFTFDRLGVRVPFIVISPWVDADVEHEPATSHYDHTSLLATLRKVMDLKQGPLTKREAWAATFEELLTKRSTPRTDCPKTLPVPEFLRPSYERYKKAESIPETPENIQKMMDNMTPDMTIRANMKMSHLQREIVELASGIVPTEDTIWKDLETVHEGALFIRKQLAQFLNKKQS